MRSLRTKAQATVADDSPRRKKAEKTPRPRRMPQKTGEEKLRSSSPGDMRGRVFQSFSI